MLIFHYFPLDVNCIFHKSLIVPPIYGKLLLSFHSRGPELGGAQGPVRRSEPEPAAEDLYTNHVAWWWEKWCQIW